jgi:hypothetical protein
LTIRKIDVIEVLRRGGLLPRIRRRLRNELGRILFAVALTVHGERPLFFSEAKWLARIPSSHDALSQWQLSRAQRAGARPTMTSERVRCLVLNGDANPYSLGTEALNFLDDGIRRLRPRAVLEFGSGVSTVVITARMSEIHGRKSVHDFSIDESETYLRDTDQMLEEAGLRPCARLACRGVREQRIHGHHAPCYALDDGFLRAFLGAAPDFVLVDGPSGGGMVRFGTLPLVLGHLGSPCTFFLDDALREDEIHVASLWRKLPEVEIAAVHLVGHGLLEGRLVGGGRSRDRCR